MAVRRVRVCDAVAGVAEVAVVLNRRDQAFAMAVRLEAVDGQWLCSHLEVL
jgi:hypothetical protein